MKLGLPAAIAAALVLSYRFVDRASSADAPAPAVRKGLAVHEWGVFTVHDDIETANADLRAEWDGLPKFVMGNFAGRSLPYHGPVKKPVVYIHTKESLKLEMAVKFPRGTAAVWWPPADSPNSHFASNDLHWVLHVGEPPKFGFEPPMKPIPDGHWFEALRRTQGRPVFAAGGYTNAQPGQFWEQEKFVYYDGLVPAPRGLAISALDGKVGVANSAGHALLDVFVVDARTPGALRAAVLDRLDAGAKVEAVELIATDADGLAGKLIARLKAAGLFEDEAVSLLAVWKKEFFAGAGLAVIYRLPQDEYERRLPMTLNPKPETLVRVGLVHHHHSGSAVPQSLAATVAALDSEDFRTREAAEKKLAAAGKSIFASLVRLRDREKNTEVRARLNRLLEKHESAQGIRK